jgi:hypothetical protein
MDANTQIKTLGPQFNVEKINLGYFTIVNRESGEHRTFRVRKQASEAAFAPNTQIVGLLVGGNNEGDYKQFGFINRYGVHVWGRLARQSKVWKQYGKALFSFLTLGDESPYIEKGYTLMASNRCFVCGRTLTTPESVQSGIGPVCAERAILGGF